MNPDPRFTPDPLTEGMTMIDGRRWPREMFEAGMCEGIPIHVFQEEDCVYFVLGTEPDAYYSIDLKDLYWGLAESMSGKFGELVQFQIEDQRESG